MTSNSRIDRGAGTVPIERLPYPIDQGIAALKDFRHIILIGATPPVGFFAYPGKPSLLAPEGSTHHHAGHPRGGPDRRPGAARRGRRGPARRAGRASRPRPKLPTAGPLDQDTIGQVLGALIPEGAVICDESITTGRNFFALTRDAAPHTWLQLSGGSIGLGIPMATGAAVACPDRKVINLQADGSGLYTVQALWTQARERLDVVTLVWSNRSYAILRAELANVGALNPGPKALGMLSLDDPAVDWVSLAKGFGVEGRRVETLPDFIEAFQHALANPGPHLIEVAL